MKKEEFDNEKFKESIGYKRQPIEPYDFEKYKSINPKLTVEIYEYCRKNRSLWKIKCGKRIYIPWTKHVLEETWWHKANEFCSGCYS